MSIKSLFKLHSDGGSRGNPGHAATGFSLEKNGVELVGRGEYIGINTNNEAEYRALHAGLLEVKKHVFAGAEIHCFLDSELVVRQLCGQYKVKNERIKREYDAVMEIVSQISKTGCTMTFTSIPRSENKRADELVNKALDAAGF